ncbi:MAG: helix-turn-helix domain-containing protein [Bryobacterales bacterium]|nr:helix-turn-helix domain-containing protein [Bryobacterales bacterium]
MKLRELSKELGIAPRQVRYLIAEGFVPPPTGGRTYAAYGEEHVAAIRRYSRLKELGFPPAAIRVLLEAREGAPFSVAPGMTLVVDPELIGSGKPIEPLIGRIGDLLQQILATEGVRKNDD